MSNRKSSKSESKPAYPVLESHLRSLKLPAMLGDYSQVARRCSSENASYETYLQEVTSVEVLTQVQCSSQTHALSSSTNDEGTC